MLLLCLWRPYLLLAVLQNRKPSRVVRKQAMLPANVSEDDSQAENTGDDSLQKIKDKGQLVLGLDDSFPPMGFRDTDNNIVGYDIDLAKEVAERMGVELVITPVDWGYEKRPSSTTAMWIASGTA